METKTIKWDRDAKPYPKKGQRLMDGMSQPWKVIKMNLKAMEVTLEKED